MRRAVGTSRSSTRDSASWHPSACGSSTDSTGSKRQWQDAGARRVAYYTKLPPGTYRFRVVAATADGVASEREAELAFQLLPHWYQTRWWYALVSLVALVSLAGLAFGFYRWRVRAFEAQQRALAEQVEARTADLQQEVAQHQRTEERLQQRSAERERAEKETALIAERLSVSNSELERENDQRRRAVEEARQAERVAGRERDLLHALMDNIPDLIYFKDPEGRFTRINKAHAEALGLASPAGGGGQDRLRFPRAGVRAPGRAEDERELIDTGQALLDKVEHDARSGRWYLATKVPLSDADGRARRAWWGSPRTSPSARRPRRSSSATSQPSWPSSNPSPTAT